MHGVKGSTCCRLIWYPAREIRVIYCWWRWKGCNNGRGYNWTINLRQATNRPATNREAHSARKEWSNDQQWTYLTNTFHINISWRMPLEEDIKMKHRRMIWSSSWSDQTGSACPAWMMCRFDDGNIRTGIDQQLLLLSSVISHQSPLQVQSSRWGAERTSFLFSLYSVLWTGREITGIRFPGWLTCRISEVCQCARVPHYGGSITNWLGCKCIPGTRV